MMISDFAKDFYKDLDTLFTNLKPRNKKVGQIYIDSNIVAKSIHNIINFKKYLQRFDTNNKSTSQKF